MLDIHLPLGVIYPLKLARHRILVSEKGATVALSDD